MNLGPTQHGSRTSVWQDTLLNRMTHPLDLSLTSVVEALEAAAKPGITWDDSASPVLEIMVVSPPSMGQGRQGGGTVLFSEWFVTVNFPNRGKAGAPGGSVRGQRSPPGQLSS